MGPGKRTILKLKARYISAVILDISSMAQRKEHVCQMEAGQENNLSAKVNQGSTQYLNCIFNTVDRKTNFALPALCCVWDAVILD